VVELSFEGRCELEALRRRTTLAAGLARRARVILLAANNVPLARIARELRLDRKAVRIWIDRYRAAGLNGLRDRPRSGRPRSFPQWRQNQHRGAT
jgi:transposase